MLFFTSDQHFGHENIINYCKRPYSNVEQMDADIVYKWNKVVTSDDTVYCLGDFTLGGPDEAEYYFSQLNGRIITLANLWHHDQRWLPGADRTTTQGGVSILYTKMGPSKYRSLSGYPVVLVSPLTVIEVSITKDKFVPISLCHYPLLVWDRQHYGAVHIHGHTHGQLEHRQGAVDVSVDAWGFSPLSLFRLFNHLYSAK